MDARRWWVFVNIADEPAPQQVVDHKTADRFAHHVALREGLAVVCRPDGRPVAVYTSQPSRA
jgi:hypothetical protein